MARRFVAWLVLSVTLPLASAAPAQTIVPWPAAGSPFCTAPGDQFSVTPTELSGLVSWFGHTDAADTLHLGGAGSSPPSGTCQGEASVATPGVVPGSIFANQMHTGAFLGCPGCGEAIDLGHAWIAREPGADRVGIDVRGWTPRTIV